MSMQASDDESTASCLEYWIIPKQMGLGEIDLEFDDEKTSDLAIYFSPKEMEIMEQKHEHVRNESNALIPYQSGSYIEQLLQFSVT